MLRHVPPLLTPDALHALASMGHGDELAIVDAFFPAARLAREGGARLVHLPGADMPGVLQAVLALHDGGVDVSSENITAVLKAANINVAGYWAPLFAKMLAGKNIDDMLMK